MEWGRGWRFRGVVRGGGWMSVPANSSPVGEGGAATRHLLPFKMLIQDRPAVEQRMFRELQEGLLEAESRRGSTGTWPTPMSLAEESIPPFARDPTARSGSYDWHLTVNGAFVNYLGVPRGAGAPEWLVLAQEPDPAAPPDPARE